MTWHNLIVNVKWTKKRTKRGTAIYTPYDKRKNPRFKRTYLGCR